MSREWYVPLECAREELQKRSSLRREVERWWKKDVKVMPPDLELFDVPAAVFARQLATCRYEDIVFCLMAKKAGLLPLWLEYTGDKMSPHSSLKRTYLKRRIYRGRGRKGGFRFTMHHLADIEASGGKRLSEIETPEGPLPEVHRRLQDQVFPGAVRRDLTAWYSSIPEGQRYDGLLSLSVAHSVLFEDYHGGESGEALNSFRNRVVEPAWQRVVRLFGIKPLIARMPWGPEFAWYPADGSWVNDGIVPEELLW